MHRVLSLFGARSEIRELAPVLHALAARAGVETLQVASSQSAESLEPAAAELGLRIDRELCAPQAGEPPAEVLARVLTTVDPLLADLRPDLLLVPGASATALAGALAAFARGIPVGHLEAGPRDTDARSPLPGETSRRLISRLASLHLRDDAGPRIADAILHFLAADGRADLPLSATPRALSDFVDEAKRAIREISPEQAHRLLGTPDHEGWHFVDVREPDEYAAGHIPTARSSPRGFLEVKADLEHGKRDPWLADRGRKLLLYCGGGHRSALAAKTLREMGFREVLSLAGGYTAWTERGYPVER